MSRNRPLPPPQLVLHHRRIHESRHYYKLRSWIQFATYPSPSSRHELHSQIKWGVAILQEMSGTETRSRTSLLNMSNLRAEDGSSLPLVGDMCGIAQLQSFPPLPDIHDPVLFRLLWSFSRMGVEGNCK